MSAITYVGIAEYRVARGEDILACSALGSCVGVCLWDCETRLAGLAHVLLPSTKEANDKSNPVKFADLGTEKLVAVMEAQGAVRRRIRAKLVGGACLYRYEHACAASEIGTRNIEAVRLTLKRLGIHILAEHVGGDFGRSMRLSPETFEVRVHVLSRGTFII